MVRDALRGYLAVAGGVTEVTAARATAAAQVLVEPSALRRLGLGPAWETGNP